jgi:hypothetical protein
MGKEADVKWATKVYRASSPNDRADMRESMAESGLSARNIRRIVSRAQPPTKSYQPEIRIERR